MYCDLLVTTNTESSDSVPCYRVARLSTRAKLLQHLGGTGKLITGLTNTAVDDHLCNTNLAHDMIVRHFCYLNVHRTSKEAMKIDGVGGEGPYGRSCGTQKIPILTTAHASKIKT